jgi:catechol 2,3-dioxygenase-like lactoylglutathione lyase family enzyme
MKLIGTLHTGFTVSDIERSIAFYRDTFGMTLVHRQEGTAPYLGTITGFSGVRLKIALLKATPDDAHILELLEYTSHPAPATDRATNLPGNAHLCLRVDDIEQWYRALVAQGVVAISPPVRVTAGINTGAHAVYVRDPDGFTIELYQSAPSQEAAP